MEPAVTTTLAAAADPSDQLCCGAMGRTEFLLSTARRRNRPDLEQTARKIAGAVLNRADRNGSFDFGLKGTAANPALFQAPPESATNYYASPHPESCPHSCSGRTA